MGPEMRVSCPACGAMSSLDALLQHDEARAAIYSAMKMSSALARLLIAYLGLFRPESRQLTMDRVAKLLGELLPDIEAARIERSGRIYAAPVETWRSALEDMLAKRDRLTLPLKTHGYLYEVIAGYSERLDATSERAREAERLHASQTRGAAPEPMAPRQAIPSNISEQMRQFALNARQGESARRGAGDANQG